MNTSRNHFDRPRLRRLTVTPGSILLGLALASVALMTPVMYDISAEMISALPARAESGWVFAGGFLALYLASIVAHEYGHVAAATSLGGGLERVVIGTRPGVAVDLPDTRTNTDQIRISVAGPAAQISLALLLVGVGHLLLPTVTVVFAAAVGDAVRGTGQPAAAGGPHVRRHQDLPVRLAVSAGSRRPCLRPGARYGHNHL